jgi:hypothetical protein
MTAPTTQQIVADFCKEVTARLNPALIDGPVRMDNTHTVVIIPLKNRGPIHVPIQGQLNDGAVESIVRQIGAVPSLKGLLRD